MQSGTSRSSPQQCPHGQQPNQCKRCNLLLLLRPLHQHNRHDPRRQQLCQLLLHLNLNPVPHNRLRQRLVLLLQRHLLNLVPPPLPPQPQPRLSLR
jgi:hypothetical protein